MRGNNLHVKSIRRKRRRTYAPKCDTPDDQRWRRVLEPSPVEVPELDLDQDERPSGVRDRYEDFGVPVWKGRGPCERRQHHSAAGQRQHRTRQLGVIACGMALRASEDALAQLVMTLVVCPMSESDRVEVAEAYLAVERLMKTMARTLDLQRVILNGA